MNHIFCIYASIVGHLGCYQLLDITNKAAMNIVETRAPVAWWGIFWVYSQEWHAMYSDRSISSFLRILQIYFQTGCMSLQSYQQWRNFPHSQHPHQHILSAVVLILANLIGVWWNLRAVLTCIFLITKDFEHFFRCFHLRFLCCIFSV